MGENQNDHKVDGVLYAKHVRTWENKVKGTHGEFLYYVLEIPTPKSWTEKAKKEGEKDSQKFIVKKDLVKFMLPRGFDPDTFEMADPLTIEFSLSGKEYAKKDNSGKDYFLELNATNIRFTDINRKRVNKDDTFTGAPLVTPDDNNPNNDDLPF